MMEERWAARMPMGMFTVIVITRGVHDLHHAATGLLPYAVLPHQPSPADVLPRRAWHKVDDWTTAPTAQG